MNGRGQDWVYVAVDAAGLFKLGCSADPRSRMWQLTGDLGRPFKLVRTWHRPLQDAMRIEMMCHSMLARHRADEAHREVYRVSLRKLVATVRLAFDMSAREDYSMLRRTSVFSLR